MENFFLSPIAHRGLHGKDAPENSLKAFERAIEEGYAIETDVHLTRDGALVLFHDDCLSRMTGDSRKISACTLDELRALRLSDSSEQIPLLSELLRLTNGRTPILLEIKNSPYKTGTFLSKIASEFEGYEGKYAVQSFQPLYVSGYRKLYPSVPCGLLTSSRPDLKDFAPPFRRIKRHIVADMSLNFLVKPDFLSFEFSCPSKKLKRFKGLKFAWTVRSEKERDAALTVADNIIFEHFKPGTGRG